MSAKRVFLEKKFRDCRFRRYEDRIIDAYLANYNKDLTAMSLAKKAKTSRATVYVHHHAIREIIPDYSRYMLYCYDLEMRKRIRNKDVSMKNVVFDLLIFIIRNKKVFGMFVKFESREPFERFLGRLKPRIMDFCRLPGKSEKSFRILSTEIVEIITEWGEKGFSDKELERVLSDIMYLLKTAHDRLLPIDY